MSASRRNGQGGLSLVEIPVALIVLSLVLVIAARTFSTAGNVQADSRSADQAMAYASAKLNELEILPLQSIADGQDEVQSPDGSTYARRWTVSSPVAGSSAKSARIEVSWRVGKRGDRVVVATLIR